MAKTIKNQIFGELIWDRDEDCWYSKVEVSPGNFVDVSIEPEDADIITVIKLACYSFTQLKKQEINLRCLVANKLLDLHNNNWSDGNKIDCQTFIESITLEAIAFDFDGNAHLYYDDGNLFSGHTIIVSIDANIGLKQAKIAG